MCSHVSYKHGSRRACAHSFKYTPLACGGARAVAGRVHYRAVSLVHLPSSAGMLPLSWLLCKYLSAVHSNVTDVLTNQPNTQHYASLCIASRCSAAWTLNGLCRTQTHGHAVLYEQGLRVWPCITQARQQKRITHMHTAAHCYHVMVQGLGRGESITV